MLQPLDPAVGEGSQAWGLHGATLEARSWQGRWPEGVDPRRCGTQEIASAFDVAPDDALLTPGMACFTVRGIGGQDWSLLCLFDPADGVLDSLSLVRTGAWVAEVAPALIPEPVSAPASADSAEPSSTALPVTCRSADPVPKTGWYEASLPADHPSFAYFSRSPGRFVRLKEGQRMLTLGVVPSRDEALVVWTWLRGE